MTDGHDPVSGDAGGRPPGTVGVPAEPLLGEPPVLAHDPASDRTSDTSVRVIGGAAAAALAAGVTGPATVGPGAVLPGPVGPVPGLAPEQTAPQPTETKGPKGARRRRRGGRWFAFAGVLALGGLGLIAAGVQSDHGTETAEGAAPASRLATAALSARRAPELVSRPVAVRAVAAQVDPIVARFPNASCVLVTDGTTVLAASGADQPVAPASNTKLLTASTALSLLGADTRLSTKVVAGQAPQAGTVTGDLVLVGGGDPLLSTATAATRLTHGQEPTTSLEMLADQVVAAGVREVTGSVLGDGSRYDAQRTVPTWPQRYVTQGTVSNLGALMVNDAWTQDPVDPSGAKGGPAADPAAHAADVFTTLLRARGVKVAGNAGVGTAPQGATEITAVQSLPISDVVGQMLTFSDNTTAEMLVKEMAAHSGTTGTTSDGIRVMVADLAARGLPTEGLDLFDGSGLSRENRVTCRLLDAVLTADGATGPIAGHLATPGKPGTLDDRFLSGPLTDKLRAKTGTLNDVAALSGWLTTDSGTPLTFSTVQNPAGRAVQAADLALQGQLLQALLTYPQTPPAEQLRPAAPVAA